MLISDSEYRLECRKILTQAASVPELLKANVVLSYWPKLEAREIDIRPLNCWLRARGCTVLLPIVEPNHGISRMRWGEFAHERTFVPNRWGIYEPPEHAELDAREIDVVLVPGLGFDLRGHRVGYGGGFYDVMFESVTAFKLGMVTDGCLLDMIPVQPHDVPIDCLVTATKIVKLQ